jgi:hypothetical protein
MNQSCGNGNVFNFDPSGGTYGLAWTDNGASGIAPTQVQIKFNQGVSCAPTGAVSLTLNGTAAGSYTSPLFCNCSTSNLDQTITLTGAQLAAYARGGLNTLNFTTSGYLEQGFQYLSGTNYATVTVTF